MTQAQEALRKIYVDETYTDTYGIAHPIPREWQTQETCQRCRGTGYHSHRFGTQFPDDWDEESRSNYFAGTFDEVCETCRSSGYVLRTNDDALPKNVLEEVQADRESIRLWAYEEKQELMASGQWEH